MNTKSALAKLLALVLTLAVFAVACGSSESDDGDNATDSDASAQTDDDTGDTDEGDTDEGDTDEGDTDAGDTDAGDTDADTDEGDTDAGDTDADTEDAMDDEEDVELTQGGGVLATVLSRGEVNCGIPTSAVAFAQQDSSGVWQGFDVDYCHAVAAAVFGDRDAVNFVPLTAAERFTAVQTGEVDLLMRTTTWTQGRDASGDQGMDFGPTTFFDGQQLAGRRSQGFSEDSTLADVNGARVCTNAGTTTEKNISDGVAAAGGTFELVAAEDIPTAVAAFVAGQCDIFTSDGSAVAGEAATNEDNADGDWVVFPATPISKEPLGPVYPQNDSEWADIINWTVFATIIADEKGITSDNARDRLAEEQAASDAGGEGLDAEALRLLGGEGNLQGALSLDDDAFLNVIEQVGNYDEIYNRHIPAIGLNREGSANARWTEGGLIYAPPAR